uniref:Uncharacterized protein n=1 Tax=viral metagenome TaxID=1070528 RepID=A0A6M3X6C7_9ZZZZ
MKHYYAKQRPRGFANEEYVYAFGSRTARDAWVDAHRSDGDVNAATCGAIAITRSEAKRIIGYKGDAVTKSYNQLINYSPDES